jgi:tetratricopeptide (TPR) repeat protein
LDCSADLAKLFRVKATRALASFAGLLALVSTFSVARSAGAETATPPWEDRFFSAPGRDVSAAARTIDEAGASEIVLFEERVETFQPDGTSTTRYRRVTKVLNQEGIDAADVGIVWAPWHEDEPKIRARVIASDGRVFPLDPKTVESSGVRAGAPDMYTDRRQLRAPLPGLARGAIIEEEYTLVSRPIARGLGSANVYLLGSSAPVRHSRLVLDAPRALPLHVVERKAAWAPITRADTKDGDRVRITFEATGLPGAPPLEDGWPDDVPFMTSVRYATGPSWREIAAHYSGLVDQQIAGADVAAWVKDARAGGKRQSRDELAGKLLDRLQREIRYTGVEFGDASIVPRRPADVLARGYGDCKDQAALLVAMLRLAGIPASVALLRVQGIDVDPKLPAPDTFDHAIVYVPPTPDARTALWIDPTATNAPSGELPPSEINRRALIANPRTEGLLAIPPAAGGRSRVDELRRITLDDSGTSRVVERTTAVGAAGQTFRDAWSDSDKKTFAEQLTTYAKDHYGAKALARFETGTDVHRPAMLEIEATDLSLAQVSGEAATVVVRSGIAFDRLPAALRGDREKPADAKPRTVDFEFVEPYTYGIVYEITPPHGFSPDPLPPSETRAIGTGTLRSSYVAGARGTVKVTFELDSGKPRITPAQVEKFRADVKAFMEADAPVIGFHTDGSVALASGKVREALAFYRRLDAEHPHQSLHARQIAETLLAAGLGQAARDEARLAVAADPKSSEAQRVLGWTLLHDQLGRELKVGADFAGAEAAYRRAIELDPNNLVAKIALALFLEYDAIGQHTLPAAHLAELDTLYDQIEKSDDTRFVVNHDLVRLRRGRFKEILARTRTGALAPSLAVRLAAVAATDGPAAAQREATARENDDGRRAEALRAAGAELVRLRRYPEAVALIDQAARQHHLGADLRAFADRVRRARRQETVKLDLKKPADLAKAILAETMVDLSEGRPVPAKVAQSLATPELARELMEPTKPGVRQALLQTMDRSTGGLPSACVVDILMGLTPEVQGRPDVGYRVKIGSPEKGGKPEEVWIGVLPEGLRVVWAHANRAYIAREALRLARAGKLDAARTWLDWFLEDEWLGRPGEPLSGSLFARVWSQDEATRGPEDVQLAATVALVANSKGDEGMAENLPALQRAHERLAATDSRRLGVTLVLVHALRRTKKLAEADALAAVVHKQFPRSAMALGARVSILHERGLDQDALKLVLAETQARPDDSELQDMLARAQESAGRLADSEKTLQRLVSSGKANPSVYNQLAWLRLSRGDASDETQAAAERGVELTRRRSYAVLHTLASVLAERDRPEQAREVLVEAMEQRDDQEAGDTEIYVMGRIAETFGLADSARRLYAGMKKPSDSELPLSSYALAQRRATRLPAPPPPAGPKPALGAPPAKIAAPPTAAPAATPAAQKL